MKVLIYLNHPAHFHLFKNVFKHFTQYNKPFLVVCKKKDILEELLEASGTPFVNVLAEGRGNSRWSMILSVLRRSIRLIKIVSNYKPDLIIGTAFELAHIGKLLGVPFVSVNEDDAEVIPLWSKYSYPWASYILSPYVCDNGKWNHKTLNYHGYHELTYLHPDHFTPDESVVDRYFPASKPYAIMRFAQLTAHHDAGISGINKAIAMNLVEILKPHMDIYITSERALESELEPFRLRINPMDMHHVLAFAKLYIGDSQTMAAEAGVLGTPFVRFNDFVDRIGYLRELEEKYQLGYGIKTADEEKLFRTVENLVHTEGLSSIFQERRQEMLAEKINVARLFIWFIENYPASVEKMKTVSKQDVYIYQ